MRVSFYASYIIEMIIEEKHTILFFNLIFIAIFNKTKIEKNILIYHNRNHPGEALKGINIISY